MNDLDIFDQSDLDLSKDAISDFLKMKLDDILIRNKNIIESIENRKEHQKSLLKSQINDKSEDFHVWKKIYNNHYTIGITAKMDVLFKAPIKLLLQWESPSSLDYRYKLITTNDWEHLNQSMIIIIMKLPEFVDTLNHTINGIIITDNNTHMKLPIINLSIDDFVNNEFEMNYLKLIKGDNENLLTICNNWEKFDFTIITDDDDESDTGKSSNWLQDLKIFCSLTDIDVKSLTRKFFIAHNLSDIFKDTIVEYYIDTNNISIYARDKIALQAFIHFLHRILNIKGRIIPKEFNYCIRKFTPNDGKKALLKELDFIQRHIKEDGTIDENLTDLERQTDEIFMAKNN